jgi:hypothetical protein
MMIYIYITRLPDYDPSNLVGNSLYSESDSTLVLGSLTCVALEKDSGGTTTEASRGTTDGQQKRTK